MQCHDPDNVSWKVMQGQPSRAAVLVTKLAVVRPSVEQDYPKG